MQKDFSLLLDWSGQNNYLGSERPKKLIPLAYNRAPTVQFPSDSGVKAQRADEIWRISRTVFATALVPRERRVSELTSEKAK